MMGFILRFSSIGSCWVTLDSRIPAVLQLLHSFKCWKEGNVHFIVSDGIKSKQYRIYYVVSIRLHLLPNSTIKHENG